MIAVKSLEKCLGECRDYPAQAVFIAQILREDVNGDVSGKRNFVHHNLCSSGNVGL